MFVDGLYHTEISEEAKLQGMGIVKKQCFGFPKNEKNFPNFENNISDSTNGFSTRKKKVDVKKGMST